MLHKISQLYSKETMAIDDDVGSCADIILDEKSWVVRYLVINTGKWLIDQKVLISPTAVIQPLLNNEVISLRLTKNEIENCPPLDADAPVSREYEIQYHKYFGYQMYWLNSNLSDPYPDPYGIVKPVDEIDLPGKDEIEQKNNLRSYNELTGYDAFALDEEIGKIDDFIFDDTRWSIKYIVVNTGNWLFSDYIFIPINDLNTKISWVDNKVTFHINTDDIQQYDDINLENI